MLWFIIAICTRSVLGPHDERCGEEVLFLHHMGVLPMGASHADRKIIVTYLARRQHGQRHPRNPILIIRRTQTVPVNECRLGKRVDERDREVISFREGEAGLAVVADKPIDACGLAIDVKAAVADTKRARMGGTGARRQR